MIRQVILSLLFIYASHAMAAIDTWEFSSESEQKRYQILIEELRCPKCQNQNLADSNSPIAADLRRELYRMIEQGQDDDHIKAYMVNRYGNFILYRPPVDKHTLLLWISPVALLFLALIVVARKGYKLDKAASSEPLSEDEKQRLATILEEYS